MTNPVLRNVTVMCYIYGLIFHLHSPVIAPPTKANPRDEAKAAACMAASPLKRKRREDRGVRSYIHSTYIFSYVYVRLWTDYGPYPSFFPKATATIPAKPPRMPGMPCRLWTPQVSWMPRLDDRMGYREGKEAF